MFSHMILLAVSTFLFKFNVCPLRRGAIKHAPLPHGEGLANNNGSETYQCKYVRDDIYMPSTDIHL